jgi:hypothetical protein
MATCHWLSGRQRGGYWLTIPGLTLEWTGSCIVLFLGGPEHSTYHRSHTRSGRGSRQFHQRSCQIRHVMGHR